MTHNGSVGIQDTGVCFMICPKFPTFYCSTMQGRRNCFVLKLFCKIELLHLVQDSCFKYLKLVKQQQLVPQENSTPAFEIHPQNHRILPPLSPKECTCCSLLNMVTGLSTAYSQTQASIALIHQDKIHVGSNNKPNYLIFMTLVNSSLYLETQIMYVKSQHMKIIILRQAPVATANYDFFIYFNKTESTSQTLKIIKLHFQAITCLQ